MDVGSVELSPPSSPEGGGGGGQGAGGQGAGGAGAAGAGTGAAGAADAHTAPPPRPWWARAQTGRATFGAEMFRFPVDEDGYVGLDCPTMQRLSGGFGMREAMSDYCPLAPGDPTKALVQQKLAGKVPWASAQEDRAVGCFLGNAIGDALGAPLEFKAVRYGSETLTGMDHVGGSSFGLAPGQWTDDASMALAMADSLLCKRTFDPADVKVRFLCWWNFGYCVSAMDHQILTSAGFMFYEEFARRQGEVLVASYDPASGHIRYVAVPSDNLIYNLPGTSSHMIEFTDQTEALRWGEGSDRYGRYPNKEEDHGWSSGVSLVVTPHHDMYVRAAGDSATYRKVHAKSLLGAEKVRFLAKAPRGIEQPGKQVLPFVAALGLRDDQVDDFLEIYGYWLGDGCLEHQRPDAAGGNWVSFCPRKDADKPWIRDRLARLGLLQGADWFEHPSGRRHPGTTRFRICNEQWFHFFDEEYSIKYTRNRLAPTPSERLALAAIPDPTNYERLPHPAHRRTLCQNVEDFTRLIGHDQGDFVVETQDPARVRCLACTSLLDDGQAGAVIHVGHAGAVKMSNLEAHVFGDPRSSGQVGTRGLEHASSFHIVRWKKWKLDSLKAAHRNAIGAAAAAAGDEVEAAEAAAAVAPAAVTPAAPAVFPPPAPAPSSCRACGRMFANDLAGYVALVVHEEDVHGREEEEEEEDFAAAAADPAWELKTKSAKWFAYWVWRLSTNQLRRIIRGLRMADGAEAANEGGIYTSSVRFRDELVRALIHAGFSPMFHLQCPKDTKRVERDSDGRAIVAKNDGWRVCWAKHAHGSEPLLHHRDGEIKRNSYAGATWCVRLPPAEAGLIIVRRAADATERGDDSAGTQPLLRAHPPGDILKASRPMVVGNCNAFRFDTRRWGRGSVGLGGNISASFSDFERSGSPFTRAGNKETSGNGSLMRLSSVPVFFHADPPRAAEAARLQSLLTHRGTEAAECCRFATTVMVCAINDGDGTSSLLAEDVPFETDCKGVSFLARSRQETPTPGRNWDLADRNWNWRDPNYRYSPERAALQPGYVGSYAMDGLSMALHCVHSTSSFREATLKAANLRGDADTVTAITAQIAGAIYGASAIPMDWVRALQRWDNGGEIALRGCKLFHHDFSYILENDDDDEAKGASQRK